MKNRRVLSQWLSATFFSRSHNFHATGQGVNSETGPHVCCCEVAAFKQEGGIHRLGEGIGRAIGTIEPRLWVDALAVTVKSDGGGVHLHFIEQTISISLSASHCQNSATAATP
jgi:hypothetical protein